MSEPTTDSQPKRPRFVSLTDTVRLPLSEGDWIEVRRSLSYGESLRLLSVGSATGGDGTERFDVQAWNFAYLGAWLRGWSFTDDQGDAVPVNEQTIGALDPDTAGEIMAAVLAHEREHREGKAGAGPAPAAAIPETPRSS